MGGRVGKRSSVGIGMGRKTRGRGKKTYETEITCDIIHIENAQAS
jgi:hypothetical protein